MKQVLVDKPFCFIEPVGLHDTTWSMKLFTFSYRKTIIFLCKKKHNRDC